MGKSPLTRREAEIADLVAAGLRNAQIAAQLCISERTVEVHVSNCFARLGISSRTSLAVWACQR